MEIIVQERYQNKHSKAICEVLHVGRRTDYDDGNNLVVTVVDVNKMEMAATNWSTESFQSHWEPYGEPGPCDACGCKVGEPSPGCDCGSGCICDKDPD